jgi:hypothetical protein
MENSEKCSRREEEQGTKEQLCHSGNLMGKAGKDIKVRIPSFSYPKPGLI